MADFDPDTIGELEHESRPDETTGERISLTQSGGSSSLEPDHNQETQFRGEESQKTKVLKEYVESLYKKLSGCKGKTPRVFHYDDFELRDGEL